MIQTVALPPETYTCAAAPEIPADTASDVDLGAFMVELWGAWRDCSTQLAAIGKAR